LTCVIKAAKMAAESTELPKGDIGCTLENCKLQSLSGSATHRYHYMHYSVSGCDVQGMRVDVTVWKLSAEDFWHRARHSRHSQNCSLFKALHGNCPANEMSKLLTQGRSSFDCF